MRKKLDIPKQYKGKEFRIVYRFLWSKTVLRGESRWFEFSYIIQENVNVLKWLPETSPWFSMLKRTPRWEDVAWAN